MTKTREHTEAHKAYMSELHSGEGNPQVGTFGWTNEWVKSNPHCLEAYTLMADMFDFYQARKHKRRGFGYKAFAKYIKWPGSPKSLLTPMKMVIDLGDPRDDVEWLEFYADQMDKKYGQTELEKHNE